MAKNKILVLVMSCNNEHFIEQEKVVRETWAKPILDGEYDNIEYYSYTASKSGNEWMDKKNHVIYCSGGDSIWETYQKTISCLKILKKNRVQYDFIYRTNTSTVLNVGLLNALVQTLDKNTKEIWGGEIYAVGVPCPDYYNAYMRGNSIILNKGHIDFILDMDKYIRVPSEFFADDNVIGMLLNLRSYLSYDVPAYWLKSYGFAWYKSSKIPYCNGCSSWNNEDNSYEYLKKFIGIQIKNYGDRTVENDYIREISSIVNIPKDDYTEELEFIRQYASNPMYWRANEGRRIRHYGYFKPDFLITDTKLAYSLFDSHKVSDNIKDINLKNI